MDRQVIQALDATLIALLWVLLVMAPQPQQTAIRSNAPREAYMLALDSERQGDYVNAYTYFNKAIAQDPYDSQVQDSYTRFIDRQIVHDNDLACRLRDWMRTK